MTDHFDYAEKLLDRASVNEFAVAKAHAHATLALAAVVRDGLAAFAEALTIAAGIAATPPWHPPVPEQAGTDAQRRAIADSAHLYAGWHEGAYPIVDGRDPRGWSWARLDEIT
jgi:hypothetical protein